MKAVMYHYVREPENEFPYFKYLHIEDFKKQLEFFGNEFGFLSQQDLIESVQTGVTKPGIILTFDDAFKDHYRYVFPELQKLGLWGVFYVPTSPYVNKKILDVHRVHLLLGKFGGERILSLLSEYVEKKMLSHSDIKDYHQMTYQTQQHDMHKDAVAVKRILNYFVSYQYRAKLIDRLMSELFEDQDQLLNDFYMSTNELSEMSLAGMMIGSHTVSHPVLSKQSDDEQRTEIENSFSFLYDNVRGITHKTFCYPHGGFHTFTNFTEKVLTENNVLFSFNVEPREVSREDLMGRPQALPRFDCNKFPFGSIR